jgi:hypothetical protein
VGVARLIGCFYDGANQRTVLLICDYCKSIVEIPLVHRVAGANLRIPPVLGALGILYPPNPLVLLIFILGVLAMGSSAETSVRCSF